MFPFPSTQILLQHSPEWPQRLASTPRNLQGGVCLYEFVRVQEARHRPGREMPSDSTQNFQNISQRTTLSWYAFPDLQDVYGG